MVKSGFTVDARGKEREDKIDRILLTINSKNRENFLLSLLNSFGFALNSLTLTFLFFAV